MNKNLFDIAQNELDLDKNRGKIDYIKNKIKAKTKAEQRVDNLEKELEMAKLDRNKAQTTVAKLRKTNIESIPEQKTIFQKIWEYIKSFFDCDNLVLNILMAFMMLVLVIGILFFLAGLITTFGWFAGGVCVIIGLVFAKIIFTN